MAYRIERIDARANDWALTTDNHQERTIYQTRTWLTFLSETQGGEPVIGALKDGRSTVGYFTGLIVTKLGLRILGSPFPGWSSDYMGLNLSSGAIRTKAIQALIDFAFHDLGCVHLEMMDRSITVRDLHDLKTQHRIYTSYEIDLTRDENALFMNMTSACRRCIRKAGKAGVSIEQAHDSAFADEYYEQLRDVFARQRLVPPYKVERVRRLIEHIFPTGNLLLLRARDRSGRSIATGIFPHLNGLMYFWGGASRRDDRLLRPNEAIQWHAMKIGKQLGNHLYDMGGGGEYKRKYGGTTIQVPWFRISKYAWVRCAREIAQRGHAVAQHFQGRLGNLLTPSELRVGRVKVHSQSQTHH